MQRQSDSQGADPPQAANSIDPDRRVSLRGEVLGMSLTSHEWRLWLHQQRSGERAALPKLRAAATSAKIDCQAEWLKIATRT